MMSWQLSKTTNCWKRKPRESVFPKVPRCNYVSFYPCAPAWLFIESGLALICLFCVLVFKTFLNILKIYHATYQGTQDDYINVVFWHNDISAIDIHENELA